MTRSFDTVVIGGSVDGLVASISLARAGSRVLLVESASELGGTLREIEFARGFRAAPLAADAGYLAPEVLREAGISALAETSSDPSVVALGEGEPLALYRDVEATAEVLQRFSRKDAGQWPRFTRQVNSLCAFLAALYREPPPRIDAGSLNDFFSLAKLGRAYRGLGRTDMVELLRTLPMSLSDWLEDWFESPRLQGALAAYGVMDISQGPVSGGTAFTFLHRHVGAAAGVFGERVRFKDGPMALVNALAERARAAGVVIETGTALRGTLVRDDRIGGVTLASGEEISCSEVLSSLDPRRSLLEVLDPMHLDPEFMHAVRNIRFRGVTTKVLVALDGLPAVPGAPTAFSGAVTIAPSVRYLERAYDAIKYGQCSDEPFIEVRFPSVSQPNLAPAGRHVAVLHVQFTPYRLREGNWETLRDEVADRAIALVDRHLPGFASRVLERSVLAPPDLESLFGAREGAISQGEMMLDQILFMRPVAGWSRYAMPVPGFYLCGSGTHPGNGITGMSGWLAARALVAGRSRK